MSDQYDLDLPNYESISDETTDTNTTISKNEVWQIFFDGASRMGPKEKNIAGAMVVFISL